MSQRAPGYRFQNHVPPTSPPRSNTRARSPSSRRRWSMYRPANPAPTTATSMSNGLRVIPGYTASLAKAPPQVPPCGLEVVDHRPLRRVRVPVGDGVENLLVVPV